MEGAKHGKEVAVPNIEEFEHLTDNWDKSKASKEVVLNDAATIAKRWEKIKRENVYYSCQCKTKDNGFHNKRKVRWQIKISDDNEEGHMYYIGLAHEFENFYNKNIDLTGSHFLDIFAGNVLTEGESNSWKDMESIFPGDTIHIFHDFDEGSLFFRINDEETGMKITKESLKKGSYHLSAMWMKDDDYLEIINPK